VSEIATQVGISRSRVYAYLEKINAGRAIAVDASFSETIQNCLHTLANLSAQFVVESGLPNEERASIRQQRADTLRFSMLLDRVDKFLRNYYANHPATPTAPELPSPMGRWEDKDD
jgi:hypothetical protein